MDLNAMEVDTPSWIVSKGKDDFRKHYEEITGTHFFLIYGGQLGISTPQILSALKVKSTTTPELFKTCMEHQTLDPFLKIMYDTGDIAEDIQTPVSAYQEKCVIKAFEKEYIGDIRFFKSHIQLLLRQPSRYSNSFAIVQSSGTGKSRLVDELARQWFTFSLCLRASNPRGSFSWPPPDEEVRDYLSLGTSDTDRSRVVCFLNALFENAATELSKIPPSDETLAARWRLYLKENRITFYTAVIKMAKFFESEDSESKHGKNTEDSLERHKERLNCLKRRINEHLQHTEGFPIIIFFDEAHEVGSSSLKHITSVFADLKNLDIVGIYLSTNALLHDLAPQLPHIKSERAQEAILSRPYTELLLDVFDAEFGDTASQLTFDVVRSIDKAACLGRPMWMAQLKCGYPIQDILKLAEKKLSGAFGGFIGDTGRYAILACRLLFQSSAAPHELVEELVASHLGFAYFVSQDRSAVHVGYPPEPFVSAAAARIMTTSVGDQWVSWLQKIVANRWLSRGDRGELVSRVVFTLARDQAWKDRVSFGTVLGGHEPVSLCAFLKHLVGEVPWKTLQNAKPINIPVGSEGSIPLGTFVNTSVIDFTCFTVADDESIFTHRGMVDALLLGAAVVCTPNQRMYDHMIVFLIRPARGMVKDNIGLILEQVKNRKAKTNPIIDPASLPCGTDFPIISIVHNLAQEGNPHAAPPPLRRSTRQEQEEPQSPHYCLYLYSSPLIKSDTVRDLLDADSIPVQYRNSFTQNPLSDGTANHIADEGDKILRHNGFYGISSIGRSESQLNEGFHSNFL